MPTYDSGRLKGALKTNGMHGEGWHHQVLLLWSWSSHPPTPTGGVAHGAHICSY